MAKILNDADLNRLIGTVIVGGSTESVRPNSYILRLGDEGEFINTGKEFKLGLKKKGIILQPGHAVGVTSKEIIDFTRETVHKLYPGCDLHGWLSPTTDLSREGIVAASTQIDAGFHGSLNWTLNNTSNDVRRFLHGERLFRLTVMLLEEGETPSELYAGSYQGQSGYTRSQRVGPPAGMRANEWMDSQLEGGPEALLEGLIKSGYPWNILGQTLQGIDQQFRQVTTEYAEIADRMEMIRGSVDAVKKEAGESTARFPGIIKEIIEREAPLVIHQHVRDALHKESVNLINDLSLRGLGAIGLIVSIVIGVFSSDKILSTLKQDGGLVALGLGLISLVGLYIQSARSSYKKKSSV